jgi:hypothetical protein
LYLIALLYAKNNTGAISHVKITTRSWDREEKQIAENKEHKMR